MPADSRQFKLRHGAILTLVLLLEGAVFYSALGRERAPESRPLEFFPYEIQGWRAVQDLPVDKETQDVLRADDTLSRVYANSARSTAASLFLAYFRTQRTGQAPHSPKNCLPGSGWEPTVEGYLTVPVPGEAQPIRINRYVVARGNDQSVVLYWYQSHRRVIANEFAAKFWLVADSIRYRRSDTSLVRVVVPVVQGDYEQATRTGMAFVQATFPVLWGYLPS